MTLILDIYQNIGINDPSRSAPIFGPDVELTKGSTISGTVIPITQQEKDKQEGINTLRDLGNEYGTLNQSDRNRLDTIFNSKQPLTDQDRAFLEKEADQLYAKIPQVADNKARTLLTDTVLNNYNGTYSDAFNDLNKLLSKVDNVFNTDKNDVVADAKKASDSLRDGLYSNQSIAGPWMVNGNFNVDRMLIGGDISQKFELDHHIHDIQRNQQNRQRDEMFGEAYGPGRGSRPGQALA
jgi:hypothetical protein